MTDPAREDVEAIRRMLNPQTRPLWEGVGPRPEWRALDALDRIAAELERLQARLNEMEAEREAKSGVLRLRPPHRRAGEGRGCCGRPPPWECLEPNPTPDGKVIP